MSVRVTSLVWTARGIPATEKVVLLFMADKADDQGAEAWPSVESIMLACGCSERHVRNVLSKYLESGLLVVTRPENTGQRKSRTYAFNMTALRGFNTPAPYAPLQDVPPAQPAPLHTMPPAQDAEYPGTTCPQTIHEPSDIHTKRGCTTKPNDADADFEAWWQQYPRKVGKGQARKAYAKARQMAGPQTLMDGVLRYAADRTGENPEFTKHASTWLNGECWLDEPMTRQPEGRQNDRTNRQPSRQSRQDQVAAQYDGADEKILRACGLWPGSTGDVEGELPDARDGDAGTVVDGSYRVVGST